MAGNSQRKGAIRKTGKGNPTAGSGGRVRRGLEGRARRPRPRTAPTTRSTSSAKKAEQGRRRAAASAGAPGPRDAEWVAGRNSVVEALRAGMPVTGVYVAEGAERDGRLREAFQLAAERGHRACSR